MAMLPALVLAAFALPAKGTSLYLAKLCAGHACTDNSFPILDYDPDKGRCICRAHPCWNDNGVEHDCSTQSGLHLSFEYTADRNLTCACKKVAQQTSVYISRDLCPGHRCDSKGFPILDWEPVNRTCFCRKHPCKSNSEKGPWHECEHPRFPILSYREDIDAATGVTKPKCECLRSRKPNSQLRGGSSSNGRSELVILSNGERCGVPRHEQNSSYFAW